MGVSIMFGSSARTLHLTEECEDITWICWHNGRGVPCCSEQVAQSNAEYYSRQGEETSVEKRVTRIRCGEVWY